MKLWNLILGYIIFFTMSFLAACSNDSGNTRNKVDNTPPITTLLAPLTNKILGGQFTIKWNTLEDNPSSVEILL